MGTAGTGKFRVGDRVRFNTKEPENCALYTKDDLTVIAYYGDDSFDVRYPGGLEQTVEAYDLELADQPQLTIQSGKFYLTRDGRKVGPATPSVDTDYPWWVGDSTYTDSGAWLTGGHEDDNDLVAEADEPPVAGQRAGSTDYSSTAGFTVPVLDEDDFDICGHRDPSSKDSDDDIVQLSVGELTAALADSLKVARKVERPLRVGDRVTISGTVSGIDKGTTNVILDGLEAAKYSRAFPTAVLSRAA